MTTGRPWHRAHARLGVFWWAYKQPSGSSLGLCYAVAAVVFVLVRLGLNWLWLGPSEEDISRLLELLAGPQLPVNAQVLQQQQPSAAGQTTRQGQSRGQQVRGRMSRDQSRQQAARQGAPAIGSTDDQGEGTTVYSVWACFQKAGSAGVWLLSPVP